jgi:uncharacterized SAM-binding protein YcdF (DUF218 family)
MKGKIWSGLKMNQRNGQESGGLSSWIGDLGPSGEEQGDKVEGRAQEGQYVDSRPIEPEGKKPGRPSILKWIIFLVLIAYMLLSYFHVPILTRLGEYLIVQQPLKKADLIVCMEGKPVELGLAAAEVYKRGFAPKIFIPKEEPPDGNEVLKARGVHYPEESELLIMMLRGLGVPRSACITSDHPVGSALKEAQLVRDLAKAKEYHSIIIVTSPAQTRCTWLIFKHVFAKDEVKIIMTPSRYTNFKADNWWKTGKYVNEVIIEYQRLIYYTVKYLW